MRSNRFTSPWLLSSLRGELSSDVYERRVRREADMVPTKPLFYFDTSNSEIATCSLQDLSQTRSVRTSSAQRGTRPNGYDRVDVYIKRRQSVNKKPNIQTFSVIFNLILMIVIDLMVVYLP